MPFNLHDHAENDKVIVGHWINEIIRIAGVAIEYMPVNLTTASAGILADKNFRGENPSFTYLEPILMKGVLRTTPEAAKMWQAMGFFSNEAGSLVFSRDDLLENLGRRPMPRDRIKFIYNSTSYEVTDALEISPQTVYGLYTIEVKLKKIVEGFEDQDVYDTYMPGDDYHPSAGSGVSGIASGYLSGVGTSGYDMTCAYAEAISASIESGISATTGAGLGSGYGSHDASVFGGW